MVRGTMFPLVFPTMFPTLQRTLRSRFQAWLDFAVGGSWDGYEKWPYNGP